MDRARTTGPTSDRGADIGTRTRAGGVGSGGGVGIVGPGAGRAEPELPRPTVASASKTGTGPFAAGFASLESVNAVGLAVTIVDDVGVLERVDAGSDAPGRERATFEVVPGLADPGCVSFRARDGRYLRHASWRLRVSQDEGTELFGGDATFCVRAGSVPDSVSLESFNYPGAFVRHRGTELWVDWPDGAPGVRADASFRPRPPLQRLKG